MDFQCPVVPVVGPLQTVRWCSRPVTGNHTVLEELVRSTSVWDDQHHGELANLSVTLSFCFKRLGRPGGLEDAILRHRAAVDLTPCCHANKAGRLNNLKCLQDGVSFTTWLPFIHVGR